MAAVRCAARRLCASLLQPWRTQEERRLLAPSRLMRSRHLSSQVSGERAATKILKKEEPYELKWEEMIAKLDKLAELQKELQKETGPSVFLLRMMSIGRAAKTVVFGTAKLTLVFVAAAVALGGDEVEAQAVALGGDEVEAQAVALGGDEVEAQAVALGGDEVESQAVTKENQ